MKKKNKALIQTISLGFLAVIFLWPGQTAAQDAIQVQLRIESPVEHIVQKTITLEADCEINDSASSIFSFSSSKAICALEQASELGLLSYQVTASSFGLFLDRINNTENAVDFSEFWIVRHNNKLADLGLADLELNNGDELLLTYGAWDMDPLKVELSTSTAELGDLIDINIFSWEDESNAFITQNQIVSSSIHIGTEIYEITSSSLSWEAQNTGDFSIYVEQKNKTRSKAISLSIAEKPPAPQITLHIVSGLNEAVDTGLTLEEACSVSDSASSTFSFSSSKAICALEQASDLGLLSYQVTALSFGLFLDRINTIENAVDFSEFWIVRHNNKLADLGLADLELNNGDELLLTYGAWDMDPLFLEASATSTEVGTPINISSLIWSDESNIFEPYSGSLDFYINSTLVQSASGTLTWIPDKDGDFLVFAHENGKSRSHALKVKVLAQTVNQSCTTCGNSVAQPPQTNSQGIQTDSNVSKSIFNLESAVDFLIKHQNTDGSFGSSTLYTDWTALSFASHGLNSENKNLLKTYLLSNPSPFIGINTLADFERRAMALMALGINPYSDTNLNYIEQITAGFDGTQFGDSNLVNDDIFALIVLNKAGYAATESMISKSADFILSKQTEGSWGSVDMTAAGIQALSAFTDKAGVKEALSKARSYLVAEQGSDAGFGNTYSSSWAIQGILALGEDPELWVKNNKNPFDYLAAQQGEDGGILASENINNRIWATAYAIPASQKKTWEQLLFAFTKPQSPSQNNKGDTTQSGSGGFPIPNIETNADSTQIIEAPMSEAKTEPEKQADERMIQNNKEKESAPGQDQTNKAAQSSASNLSETKKTQSLNEKKISDTENKAEGNAEPEISGQQADQGQNTEDQKIEEEKGIEQIPESEPLIARIVKKIFNSALVATLSLGVFIGWRFIRTLV
ncbi:MAG: DUF4430 domain-containing protein [Candidatus Magasanikbacteria bacterium]|nr:DUF4430 domain-containing protein [Candidatus Magasanikbacteria bacterium]